MPDRLQGCARVLKLASVCGMLAVLAGCSMPTTRGYIAEANASPGLWLLSPIWLPMGALYDGIEQTTGATPQDVSSFIGAVHDTAVTGYGIYNATQGGYAPPAYGGGAAPPTYTGGYSQRQSFEDCARNYQGISPQLEAQCRQSATNLDSMGPMLQRRPDGSFVRQCGAHGCK